MAAEIAVAPPVSPRPFAERRVLLAVFIVLLALLAAGYYLFLRPDYVVLSASVRPSDAAAIVAQLDTLGIPHRLRDNGQTVLVPADQADNARVQLAGSDSVTHTGVGFELFNHSDMGLTDFAQKINYQRALQGELARTIMMMDGIDTARVHLAIPEHSLFRATRSDPKAAVEVVARVGSTLTLDRVVGIQRLVAAAVPDLTVDDVVILDSDGRVVSQTTASVPSGNGEQAALQNYLAERARAAVQSAMPGLTVGVHVMLLPTTGGATADPALSDNPVAGRAAGLRVTIVTEASLGDDDQRVAREAVTTTLRLGSHTGDAVLFQVGPVQQVLPAAPVPIAALPRSEPPAVSRDQVAETRSTNWTLVATVSAGAVLIALLLLSRRRTPGLPPNSQDALAERLRLHLPSAVVVDA